MSALQAGMVFHTQLEDFTGIYHDMVAEHVKCPWDEELFHAGAGRLHQGAPCPAHRLPARPASARCRSSTGASSCRWL